MRINDLVLIDADLVLEYKTNDNDYSNFKYNGIIWESSAPIIGKIHSKIKYSIDGGKPLKDKLIITNIINNNLYYVLSEDEVTLFKKHNIKLYKYILENE